MTALRYSSQLGFRDIRLVLETGGHAPPNPVLMLAQAKDKDKDKDKDKATQTTGKPHQQAHRHAQKVRLISHVHVDALQ